MILPKACLESGLVLPCISWLIVLLEVELGETNIDWWSLSLKIEQPSLLCVRKALVFVNVVSWWQKVLSLESLQARPEWFWWSVILRKVELGRVWARLNLSLQLTVEHVFQAIGWIGSWIVPHLQVPLLILDRIRNDPVVTTPLCLVVDS